MDALPYEISTIEIPGWPNEESGKAKFMTSNETDKLISVEKIGLGSKGI